MNIAQEARRVLADRGSASIKEIADALDIEEGTQRWKTVGQALSTGTQLGWSERVGRGKYRWALNGTPPALETSDELKPLVDSLALEWSEVGLTYLARSQDGAFICKDQHGVAWKVEVTVTAKLL